jgi:hypothetical protein
MAEIKIGHDMNRRQAKVTKIGLTAIAWTAGLLGCSSGPGGSSANPPARSHVTSKATQRIRKAFPAASVELSPGGGIAKTFGPSLATGASPVEAADAFRKGYAAAMGIDTNDLVLQANEGQNGTVDAAAKPIALMVDKSTKQPKFWLYTAVQTKGGVPVYRARLGTLVRNDGTPNVVLASSTLRDLGAFSPPSRFNPTAPDLAKSLAAIPTATGFLGQSGPKAAAITKASAPKLVVFAGTEEKEHAPRMAIEYTVETEPRGKWHMVADATTGDVLHVENLVAHLDISGKVEGRATQGSVAMECAPAVARGLSYAEVVGPDTSQAFADVHGAYLLSSAETGLVNVTSQMGGRTFDVFNVAGAVETLTSAVVAPGPADFLHNAANSDPEVLAQVNAYVETNELREFVLSYVPDYPAIGTESDFPINVNLSHADDAHCPGDGFYDGASLNLCKGGDKGGWTYTNTAFGSVVHHEYGHRLIAASPYSDQGEYGEGMSDTLASLFSGQHGMSFGFFVGYCDYAPRDALNQCQFDATICSSCASSPPAPSPGEIHFCGLLLSGTIWDIRVALSLTHPGTFVDIINSLTLHSILVHVGSGINSQIAVDMLTLDDDDNDLTNGTPHRAEICSGFARHGMPCPPIAGNAAPSVEAGPDQVINLPSAANLTGSATDDGLPDPPHAVTVVGWSLVNGPSGGTATLGDASAWNTVATFSAPGIYVFRLIVTDGSDLGQDDVTITVNPVNLPPVVEAGPDQTVAFQTSVSLTGTASDDGQPAGSSLASTWSLVSGPAGATVGFADPTALTTTATLSLPGTYVLSLAVSDGLATAADTLTITVTPLNTAPTVEAGPNQTIVSTGIASLAGTATDDGLPLPGTLTNAWSKVSGPGNVVFGNPSALKTTASFTLVGTYVLKLTVSDGALAGSDSVVITVNAATPCSDLCNNPVNITLPPNYQGTNIGTSDLCLQTYSKLSGGNCGNFVSPRTTTVNGTTMACSAPNGGGGNWSSIPAKRNGGYCIHVTPGQKSWAYLTLW